MSREAVAHELDLAAEALARAAHALRAIEPAPAAVPEAGEPVPPRTAPAPRLPQRPPQESAFTECPAHRQPFVEGKFGPYCTGKGEPDGNWVNERGYCKVTPKSAGAWLKQHPKGAPTPEEVPF